MRQAPLFSILAGTALFFASCKGKSGTSDLMIPKKAAIVVHIDNSSLSSKLSWKDIQATNWFKEASKDANDSLVRTMMNNPEAAGVDINSDLAFFLSKPGNSGIAVFQGSLKSKADFEKFNHEILKKSEKTAKTEKSGDMQFIRMSDEALATWDNSKFVYITAVDMNENTNTDESYGETPPPPPPAKYGTDSLVKYSKELYSLDSDESIGDDDRFAAMMKEEGDMHLWMNQEEYAFGEANPMMSMMKISTLVKGNVSASTMSFDNGKITWKTKQYFGKEVSDVLAKYDAKDVNKDLINRIPSQNVVAVMAGNYPPEGLKAILKLAGVDGMANAALGQVNYSLDELVKANKGDFLMAVTDYNAKQVTETVEGTSYSYSATKPEFKVLVALSVQDKASFDKLIGVAEKKAAEAGEGNPLKNVFYKTNNEWFAASNSSEHVDKFLAGGNNNVTFADRITGHPFGMYVDFQKIMASSKGFFKTGSEPLDISMKLWQDMIMTGGEFKDGHYSTEMVVNMVDKKTNSLVQLNKYFDQMYTAFKNKSKTEMDATVPYGDSMKTDVQTID
jgi:hypothetical protein